MMAWTQPAAYSQTPFVEVWGNPCPFVFLCHVIAGRDWNQAGSRPVRHGNCRGVQHLPGADQNLLLSDRDDAEIQNP